MQAVLNGKKNQFRVETDYPWSGDVKIQVENEADTAFTYAIRVPGWCRSYSLKLNGEAVDCPVENGYLLLDRCWKNGDVLVLFHGNAGGTGGSPIQKSGRMSVRWQ